MVRWLRVVVLRSDADVELVVWAVGSVGCWSQCRWLVLVLVLMWRWVVVVVVGRWF